MSNIYMILIGACVLIGSGIYFLILSVRIGSGDLRIFVKDPEKVLHVYRQLHIVSIVRVLLLVILVIGILVLTVYIIWRPSDVAGRLITVLLPVLCVLIFLGGLDRFNKSYVSYLEKLTSESIS